MLHAPPSFIAWRTGAAATAQLSHEHCPTACRLAPRSVPDDAKQPRLLDEGAFLRGCAPCCCCNPHCVATVAPWQIDIKENDAAFEIAADVPGVPKENVKVELGADNTLHLSASHATQSATDDERGGWKIHREERSSEFCSRAIRLPPSVDKTSLSAKVEDGVLRVTLPKLPDRPTSDSGRTVIPVA